MVYSFEKDTTDMNDPKFQVKLKVDLRRIIEVSKIYEIYENDTEPELYDAMCRTVENSYLATGDIGSSGSNMLPPDIIIKILEYLWFAHVWSYHLVLKHPENLDIYFERRNRYVEILCSILANSEQIIQNS